MTNAVVALEVPSKNGTLIAAELVTDQGVYGMVDLAKVRPSPDNRKRFNEQALQELAASIRSMGVAQPILIRPVTPTAEAPEEFEIVAGERRFRASKIAGNTEIPALRRNLSDLDAAKIRILENLQRENPHPMEEAEGYQLLMLQHGFTADQLVDEVKKSRAYIYGRLKLCALTTEVREQFLDNKLPASTALLIARIPVPALQVKAAAEILTPPHGVEPLSHRAAASHIQNRYMLNLSTAVFSVTDAKLLAAAGACTKCPKRAGNQPEVFEGIDANICTDPDCFAEKRAAHGAALLVHANKQGIPVIEGEEGSRTLSGRYNRSSELVSDDMNLWYFERNAPKTQNNGFVATYLKDVPRPPIAAYVKKDDGSLVAMYKRADIQVALEVGGACETVEAHAARISAARAADPAATAKEEAEQKKRSERQARVTQENAYRLSLYKQLRERVSVAGLSLPALREFAKAVVEEHDLELRLHDLYDTDVSTDLEQYIDNADAGALQLLLIDVILGQRLEIGMYNLMNDGSIDPDDGFATVLAMARHEGVDVDAVRAEAYAPAAPADLPETPAATPAEAPLLVLTIMLDDITQNNLVNYIRANPEHLNEVTKAVLAHPRGELVGMLEQAANSLGYTYAAGETWVIDPVRAAQLGALDQVEQAATPAAADQAELQQPATHDDAEDLAEQLASVETAKPSTRQPAAKTVKAKPATKSTPAPAAKEPAPTTAKKAATPWPFPRTSDGTRPPAAESPSNDKTSAQPTQEAQ